MRTIKTFCLIMPLCMFFCKDVVAQSREQYVADSLGNIVFGKYFVFSFSSGLTSLRDRGNSALNYTGLVTSTGTSLYKINNQREFELTLNAARGNLIGFSKEHAHHQMYTAVSLSVSQLYTIHRTKNLHLKFGPGVYSQLNTRLNTELFNTYNTTENFSSLNLIGKLDYYFKAPARSGKFLSLFPYRRPERTFKLSYRVSGSVLPLSFRPGYAYVDNIVVNNPDFLGDHRLSIGGYNLTSEITLTKFIRNKNAFTFSYRWNALTSGQKQFEAATHSLSVGFLFNYK